MMHVWIYYPTILGVLYEAWTMSDRGGQIVNHRLKLNAAYKEHKKTEGDYGRAIAIYEDMKLDLNVLKCPTVSSRPR